MRRIKLIEVRSELGAGTRGASLGIDALKVACLNKGSDYFRRFNSAVVPDQNQVLFDKNHFPYAKHIDSIYNVLKGVSSTVEQTLRFGEFPLVLAADHSNAAGTIAGIKAAYPHKTLGVVWIDAHADIHSPYTTPSGNVHGMPLAMALGADHRALQHNQVEPETEFFWRKLKDLGEAGAKITPDHLVYVVVRDTEPEEDRIIEEHGIRNFKLDEFRAKGARRVAREIYEQLRFCDLVYISFDVDSLDSRFSKGTGTPVELGLDVAEAMSLCRFLLENNRVVCFEMGEINPTLDSENTMASNAFDILEVATDAIQERLRLDTVTGR
jgi:arginase